MTPGAGLMERRRLLTFAAVALTAIAGVTAAHAASAGVPGPAPGNPQPAASDSEEDLWRREDLLSDFNYWIDAQPGLKASGYVADINDPEAGSITLVWHGPSDRMQRQIMDEARRRNIPVSIEQRNHSMNDLEQAAQQLTAIDSGTGVFQNFTVSSVGTFHIYFDGVTVLGEFDHPPAEGIAAADIALAQALTAITGAAVRIEHGKIEF